jgi:hypothetical protein
MKTSVALSSMTCAAQGHMKLLISLCATLCSSFAASARTFTRPDDESLFVPKASVARPRQAAGCARSQLFSSSSERFPLCRFRTQSMQLCYGILPSQALLSL